MIENKARETMILADGNNRIRRCGACGNKAVFGSQGRCQRCGGPLISLGPIQWTEDDEIISIHDRKNGIKFDPFTEEDEFQDIVGLLWDMIEEGEEVVIDQVAEIEELKAEIVINKNAVKMVEEERAKLEAKLADETIKGKVKKAFGTEY